jgi:hypothetical protein
MLWIVRSLQLIDSKLAVRVGFEPKTALAIVEVADSPLLTMPNLPKMPPTIARYCTLAL